jgi:hypothetical protein
MTPSGRHLPDPVRHVHQAHRAPRAYPHQIEVVDAPDIHFAIVFDQPMPGDIGYRASASAYSREVACGDVQHAYRRSARIPIHQDRSADRDPQQPRRRMGER